MSSAYDYDTQQWITGVEGTRLALKQTRDELALLDDLHHRASFAKLIGLAPENVDGYVRTMRAQEARLIEELA